MRVNMTNNDSYRFMSETVVPGIYAFTMKRALYIKTKGEIFVDGVVCRLLPGDLLLLSPDDICYVAEGITFDAVCWYYSDSDLFGVDEAMPQVQRGVYKVEGQTADVRSIFARAAVRGETETTQEILLTRMLLSELILHLPECVCTQHEGGKIAQAATYLKDHYTESVSLDTLCESIGLSKFYLCRAFRRDTGMTPHAYLNLYRVLCADRLLRDGVGAMASGDRVGYRDYTTFFRSYKRIVGSAPSVQLSEATV